jgi:DoxX-like family
MAEQVGKIVWTGRVISWAASAAFLFSAFMKWQGGEEVAKGMQHLGLPETMVQPLALLEAACVAIYLFPPTAVLGAILLAGYMGGAICTHWRVGDPVAAQIAIGIAVWLGIYLRDGRLKKLIPLRLGAE